MRISILTAQIETYRCVFGLRPRRCHNHQERRLRFPNSFINLGEGDVAGIPYLILYGVAAGLIIHVLLERTVFGYNIRATGGNRGAAAANGIRIERLDIWLYAISGGISALAGILGAARFSTASPAAGGADLTFQVITAIIIGGTSLFGGNGTIAGSALGAILFAEIDNGLQVINVDRSTRASSSA